MTDKKLIMRLCAFYNIKEKDGQALCKIKAKIIKSYYFNTYYKHKYGGELNDIKYYDFNNAAILGIIEGINTYDVEKAKTGMKLTSWCTYKIKEEIRKIIDGELKLIKLRANLKKYSIPKVVQDCSESLMVREIDGIRKKTLKRALRRIPQKQAKVIKQYFGMSNGERQTFEDIGKSMGVSKQWVYQIYKEGMKNLRKEFFKIYPELFQN